MKKFIIPMVALTFGLAIAPSVKAVAPTDSCHQPGVDAGKSTCNVESKTYSIVLNGDAALDIEVEQDETFTVDLAGHKLTNYSNALAVILVKSGGTFTLQDSSTDKTGSVTTKDGSTGNVPIIDNKGTFDLQGGTITTQRVNTALIYNDKNANLTISGGSLKTSGGDGTLANSAWGLTNAGTTTITGGVFDQQGKVSLIQNEGSLIIDGGSYTASEESYSLITNSSNGENPSLTINNGDFQTNLVISSAEGAKNENTTITGGTFKNPSNIVEYLASGLEFDENGTVVEKKETPSSSTEAQNPKEDTNTKNPNTADNIVLYVTIATLAVISLGYVVVKNRVNN